MDDVFAPHLPNRRSSLATPASHLIDGHYADLGIVRRWTWDRYHRLASFLNLTAGELASLVCMPHRHLNTAKMTNRFSGSTALLLTLLEAKAMKGYSTDIIADPIAKL